MDINLFRSVGGLDTAARVLEKIEAERSILRNAAFESHSLAERIREMSGFGSEFEKLVKSARGSLTSGVSVFDNLVSQSIFESEAFIQLRRHEEERNQSIRRMLEPLEVLRTSFLLDSTAQNLIKESVYLSNISRHLTQTSVGFAAIQEASSAWTSQFDDSRTQTMKLLEDHSLEGIVKKYLKGFEQVNQNWNVPDEISRFLGPLAGMQDQFGFSKLPLPVIDWSSASALAKLLGQHGLEDRLAYFGISPEGIFEDETEGRDKGYLTKKQADFLTILSLILAILMYVEQKYDSHQADVANREFQTQTTNTLQMQTQQINALTVLLEKALAEGTLVTEEKFVVRDRIALVRAKPEAGSSLEGKLFPKEVVRALDQKGKWVEIEYYHWLRGEYCTGWVLKKYLERVPSSYDSRR